MNRDEDIFAEALELPATARAAYLARACAGDPVRLARLTALLGAHDAARSFLEQPVTARPPEPATEAPGTVIGPYTLRQRLGEGGCGVVWLAEQTTPLRRTVALKVIKPGMDSQRVIARFEGERQTLALLTHPDIARLYDAGTTAAGRPYFVMEYVEGIPITRFCDEHSLPMAGRLELFARVCVALQHAHQRGIIHRDLKPSNILVALRDGQPAPKLIDFGIAKATAGRLSDESLFTEMGLLVGTPAYMSPEQAELRDVDIDTRSDVYALGVLLYELLTGRPPYDPKELVRAGLLEIRRIIREVEPPRPSTVIGTLTDSDRRSVARLRGAPAPRLTADLRGDLDWIVMRCLEKDRDRRYGTAAALAEDVRRHLRQEPVEARPPSTVYRLRKFTARHRLACASAALVTVSLIGGIVASTQQARRARAAEQVAAAERDLARAAQQAETLARTDAQRRQAQAEDLLTFMLGDFRTELQKSGRLEPLAAVGDKALAYFTALDPRDLSDAALTRQAKALTQLGEVRLEQGDFPAAGQAFTAAFDRAAALAVRHPANGDMLFERGQAEFWLGLAARRRGDRDSQREWLLRYRDTARALGAAEGPTARAQLEAVYAHHNLAVLDTDTGNLAAARVGFLAEQALLEPLLAAQPGDGELRYSLADVASWLGSVAERDGRFADAAGHYTAMAARYAALARDEPTVVRWRQEEIHAVTFRARVLAVQGHRAEAAQLFAEASTRQRALVAEDRSNRTRLSALVSLNLHQIALLLDAGSTTEASLLLAEAQAAATPLATAEPASLNFARLLAAAHRQSARLDFAAGRFPSARASLEAAREILERLLQDNRADPWVRHEAALVAILAGRVARATGQDDAAQALWRDAYARIIPFTPGSHDWRLLEPAAVSARLAGLAAAARPPADLLKTFGYHSVDPLNRADLAEAESSATSNPSQPP
ncbi:Serine/threonine-protein kinase PknB [Lacunisphaera limnophila]|uniref:Serine/threonine-protein kinase PknB n=1 Tax=Lacunisphaera limnophila TaxID=1838286 RepID=A0A1D8AXR6_9BACT|nr:serine/threonine-protein kinase [Lacunisphaera limnophila]AOS45670.1 Serine/threonine-protein kinase PknB [Lacunisphaera limnophila]